MNREEIDFNRILVKTTFLGLVLNVIAPVLMLVLAVLLTGQSVSLGDGLELSGQNDLRLIFYLLLIISAAGLFTTWQIRRALPAGLINGGGSSVAECFEGGAMKISVIIFAVNEIYAIFGLVLALLGAGIEAMMIFVALSFVGYQLFRPRRAFLEKILERIEKTESPGNG